MNRPTTPGHDVIVIGASSGGIELLRDLLSSVSADIPAAIFIVVHVGATSHLAEILNQAGPLSVQQARSGAPIECGKVYVAGPGAHLLLHDNHILLRRGPRENLSRPAIDPLFRSAAATFGGRVIGVILSGSLNDGTAGLLAVQRCGGLCVVQAPADAAFSQMPASALRHVQADYIEKAADIGHLLERLSREPPGPTPEIPFDIRLETAIAAQELATMKSEDKLGTLSHFTCPECHGSLWEIEDGSMVRYRCHTGHAFTAEAMLSAQADEIDKILGSLFRSHRERAALARRMSRLEDSQSRTRLAEHFAARAQEYEDDAELVRRLLVSNGSQRTIVTDTAEESTKANGEEPL